MQFDGDRVIVYHGVVDLRKGAQGLMALVQNPERGTWYLFSNRSRSLVKCVQQDRHGVWLAARRLEQGCFRWLEKAQGASTITLNEAELMCDGQPIKKRFLAH